MNKKIYVACVLIEMEQHINMAVLRHGLAVSEAEAKGMAITSVMDAYDGKIISVEAHEIPEDLIKQVYPNRE